MNPDRRARSPMSSTRTERRLTLSIGSTRIWSRSIVVRSLSRSWAEPIDTSTVPLV